jgi:hypothetical protein
MGRVRRASEAIVVQSVALLMFVMGCDGTQAELATSAIASADGGGSDAVDVSSGDAVDVGSADAADASSGNAADVPPWAAVDLRPGDAAGDARCCVVPTFPTSLPYASRCNFLGTIPDSGIVIVEPCWDTDPTGDYGRWQCGGLDGQAAWCGNNGLSCAVGDLCWTGEGCPGQVQPCDYPWYP